MDKILVNSALSDLIEGTHSDEACDIIIRFGSTLPEDDGVVMELQKTTESNGERVSEPYRKRMCEKGLVLFKILRKGNRIDFYRTDARDVTVPGALPQTYSILYEPKTLKFLCFAVWKERAAFTLRLFKLVFTKSIRHLEKVHGELDSDHRVPVWRMSITIKYKKP